MERMSRPKKPDQRKEWSPHDKVLFASNCDRTGARAQLRSRGDCNPDDEPGAWRSARNAGAADFSIRIGARVAGHFLDTQANRWPPGTAGNNGSKDASFGRGKGAGRCQQSMTGSDWKK